MKHYVIHLISAVLLTVLILLVLILASEKQDVSKQLAKLTEEGSGLEQERAENKRLRESGQFLEKENSENRQLLEKERAEKEQALEKLAGFEARNKDLQDKLSMIEESVAEMGRSFQIVSARDVKMLGLTFEQTPRSDADAATAISLADSLKDPTPAAFKDAAEKTLEPLFAATRELVLDAETGYVVDPVAAIVETAAKAAGLSASTAIFWDVPRKTFRSEVTVSDPERKDKDAVVSVGGNSKTFRDVTFQLSPKTTVFPFTDISLLSRNGVDLLSRTASIPVGGLYVHYFRVYSKGPWELEYVFPGDLEPESVNMNLLPLTPGSVITSSITGRTFTFHVDAKDSESDFLVIADKPFFPDAASIRLKP